MRILTTILLMLCGKVHATNYYVSNTGNDAAAGTATGTAWQTIAKVNASSFSPGDSILFKKGDSWNEKLTVPSSGNVGNPIVFGSYGTGVKPVITGLQSLNLSDQGSNIWSATATNSVKYLNTVIINGAIRAKGRHPNSTFLLTTAPSTTTTVNTGLTGTPSYVGAEIAIGPRQWIVDVAKITNQSSGVLTVSPALNYSSSGNNNYCLMNLPSLCDLQNEWAYDSASKLLTVYSIGNPTVQISSLDTCVYVKNKSYIKFTDLSFTGANRIALAVDSCNNITVNNCKFNNNGMMGIQHTACTNNSFNNDSILNSLSVAIYTFNRSDSTVIDNNFIKNTGMLYGMNYSGDLMSMGMHSFGNGNIVTNNRIDSVGYNAIYFGGTNHLIKYNYITNFCFTKSDGGAIYAYGGTTNGSLVRNNICTNGLGGVSGNIGASPGIFMDANASGVTIDSNTVIDCYGYGIQTNDAAVDLVFKYNTVVQTSAQCLIISARGTYTIKQNIFYSKDSTKFVFYGLSIAGTNTIDSNYYLRPIKEDKKFAYPNTNIGSQYSLAGWQTLWTAQGYDAHSLSTPSGIVNVVGTIYINPTLNDSTISLTGYFMDAKGLLYTGAVSVAPFQSKLLFQISYRPKRRIKSLIFQ